jgi:alpha-galactosidase
MESLPNLEVCIREDGASWLKSGANDILVHEQVDAETFVSWGADLLKCMSSRPPAGQNILTLPYDSCYSDAAAGYPDADYTPDFSPSGCCTNMTNAILATGRKIVFQICERGVDFPSAWAPPLGNTWRITKDIIPSTALFHVS